MKNIRGEIAVWLQIVAFLAIWVILLKYSGNELKIDKHAVREVPHAVTAYLILHLVFTKWAWQLPLFKGWLVPLPVLSGTWAGTITSKWIDPTTGIPRVPIPALLVIKQSFSEISCTLYTAESTSLSAAARLSVDEASGVADLTFIYVNKPRATVRETSSMHEGATRLAVICEPHRALVGDYWTSRETTGELHFLFRSKKRSQSFS